MNRLPLLQLVLAALLLGGFGCVGLEEGPPGGGSTFDAGCGDAPQWIQEAEGGRCARGPVDCHADLGCVNGVCGACTDSSQCLDYLACLPDGSCGSCTTALDCEAGEACRSGFCMPDAVPTWDLTLDPAHWERIHDDPYRDDYFPCTLTVDGVAYSEGCEVRPYGSTARNYPKKSLRIRFPEGGEHPGYSRKVTLRAEYNDMSFLRNTLGYETFRRLTRLPAPRTQYIDLRVNGTLYGLMIELERTGGKWLELNDRNRDQSMYEAEHSPPQGGLMPFADPSEYELVDDDIMYNKKAGPEGDYSDLINLIEDVLWADYLQSPSRTSTVLTRTAPTVDVNTHASYLAVMAMIQNRDHVASNYNVAWQRNSEGTPNWEIYPWDLDTTFGCVFDPVDFNNICDALTDDVWWLNGVAPYEGDIGVPNDAWMNMLIHLTLNDRACGETFTGRLCENIAGSYWNEELPRLIDAVAETIRPSVAVDPNDLNASAAEFDRAVQDVKDFLGDRRAYLEANVPCP